MSRQDEIRELISKHSRRLHKRKLQQAHFGFNNVDPSIILEIEDIEAEISILQTELDGIVGRTSSKNPPIDSPLKINVWAQEFTNSDIRLKDTIVRRRLLKIGSRYKIGVQSNQDCFITLIGQGTSGNEIILLPNQYDLNNLVLARSYNFFPSPNIEFRLDGPPGIEMIIVFASIAPIWEAEMKVDDVYKLFLELKCVQETCSIEVVK